MTAGKKPIDPFDAALGAKLRDVRARFGFSLNVVEQMSGGKHKAVVLGSNERGNRSITVKRLQEYADLYGVPITEFLPWPPLVAEAFVAINARRVDEVATLTARYEHEADGLRELIAALRQQGRAA